MVKKDFLIGKLANRPDVPEIIWNPDAQSSVNPHMLFTGSSGAGKTSFLKKIIRHLNDIDKHVIVFDLKGDMTIKDKDGNILGNYINFTAWDSPYGINPFEIDTGVRVEELEKIIENGVNNITEEESFKVRNSGPKVQVDRIIEIIQKNFLPNMGAYQKDILRYLLADTYLSKGFKYNDITTWLNDLPSLKDTQELIKRIKSFADSPSGTIFDEESIGFIQDVKADIVGIKSLESRIEESNDKEEIKQLMQKLSEKSHKALDEYMEYGSNIYTERNISANDEWFKARGINTENYSTKEAIRTVEKMSSYINALVDSGVFHSVRPPVKKGLNIVNISGLDIEIQRFIVDVWLGKVFKACKIRGNYADRTDKSRGEKCDTFAILDELKLIAGSSREKNNPYSYLNRIATEARGIGFGLIVAAQSAEHFPPEFLKNFDSQLIFKTGIADFDTVRKSFGLEKSALEFTQNGMGNALVKVGRKFEKVKVNYEDF